MKSNKNSNQRSRSSMKRLNNSGKRIKRLLMSTCKRSSKMAEKSLYTSKDLSSNKRRLKMSSGSMMIYVLSMMKEF
jgi:hypothetical protein